MSDAVLAPLADAKVLYLTTTRCRSGQPRTIEIWFTCYQGKLYLNAERAYKARVSKSGRVGLIFVPGIWTLFTSYPLISWHLARFRGARHSGCVYPGSHDLSHQSPIASGDGPCQEDA